MKRVIPTWMPDKIRKAIEHNLLTMDGRIPKWKTVPYADDEGEIIRTLCTSEEMKAAWKSFEKCLPKKEAHPHGEDEGEIFRTPCASDEMKDASKSNEKLTQEEKISSFISSFIEYVVIRGAMARNFDLRESPDQHEQLLLTPGPIMSARRLKRIKNTADQLLSELGETWYVVLPKLGIYGADMHTTYDAIKRLSDATVVPLRDASLDNSLKEKSEAAAVTWLAKELKAFFIRQYGRPLNEVVAGAVRAILAVEFDVSNAEQIKVIP
jgi:hypothetical protein